MKTTLFCAAALVLTAVPCFAAGPSWNGTWKLNQAKSKMTGDTFTIESKGNGMLHFSTGSTFAFDYACDGKAYPVIADRTQTCSGSAATGYDYIDKAGDKVLSKSHHIISPDGKTLTIHGTEMRPDGSTVAFNDVYKRESGTTGIAGKWLNVKSKGASDTMVIEAKGDWIKVYEPEYKETVEGKMDGSDLTVTGVDIPPGLSETIKTESPTKLSFAVSYKGKVLGEGTRTLSADGNTIVEEDWQPGKMNEKAIMVYERQ